MDFLTSPFSLTEDLGIDLGTANTLVASEAKGIILDEPSVVAVYKGTNEVILDGLGVGIEAYAMLGKTPTNIEAIRPLKGGVIADFEITEKLLRYFLQKASEGGSWRKPRVVVAVPSGITTVERRAVINSTERAGARKVYLVDEPMAAGLGVDLPITEAQGSMVVDIGGGTTEVAILALGGPVTVKSVKVAGDDCDEAIISFIRKNHNLQIGPQTAEELKKTIGSAAPLETEKSMEIAGRDTLKLMPRKAVITSEDVREALPLLQNREWYQKVRYGYARGGEPVIYVRNIRRYYEILNYVYRSQQQFYQLDERPITDDEGDSNPFDTVPPIL